MNPEEPAVHFGDVADDRAEALFAEIRRDLQPVRPLRLSHGFFIALSLLCAVLLGILVIYFGLRSDREVLAEVWFWGLVGVEVAAAAAVLGLNLRQAIPGRRLNRPLLAAATVAVGAVHLAGCALAFQKSPVPTPAGQEWGYWIFCLCVEVAIGLPLVVLALIVLRRGLVASPAQAGFFGGLGAGLLGEALWRLICPYSDLTHAVAAHTGGIVVLALLGMGLAVLWDRHALRRWHGGRAVQDSQT